MTTVTTSTKESWLHLTEIRHAYVLNRTLPMYQQPAVLLYTAVTQLLCMQILPAGAVFARTILQEA